MPDNLPVFPNTLDIGMTLRDLFATFAPEPTKERITHIMELERATNPHNEPRPRRSYREIQISLRWEWADDMLKERFRR